MVVGPKTITKLIRRYNGFGVELTPDEKEILMFALHAESEARGGIAAEAMRGLVIKDNKASFPKHCKWCAEGLPEWSFDAKAWIHRRATLDRRCDNPPNSYGYTTQVPEMTISDEKRVVARGEKAEDER